MFSWRAARHLVVRDEPSPLLAPNTVCFDVPFGYGEGRARLEILFETSRVLDNWSCQIIEAATHLAAMILELERATGRWVMASARRPPDGAAPLIGSSEAIRRVRERIERVAATDFTILIEGAIGPEPHPSFIEVWLASAVCDCDRQVERARQDGADLTTYEPIRSEAINCPELFGVAYRDTRVDRHSVIERASGVWRTTVTLSCWKHSI
jgi:hypothetical protein